MNIRKKYVEMAMAVIMLTAISMVFFGISNVDAKNNSSKEKKTSEKFTVVLDAGHGGFDPGKVGVDGQLESEINLSIVNKLKKYLEDKGVNVVLTRTDENGLYAESDTNKKVADMQKRCEIVNDANPDIMVSVHQNSYSSQGVKGAQVFYYKDSCDGEKIASIIQKHLVDEVDNSNGRQHKENGSYYILKNVSCPAVIVECGFLSNYSEAELLESDEYQDKLAVAIGNGILEYLQEK